MNQFLNRFTRVYWTAPLVIYLPVVVVCIFVSVPDGALTLSTGLLLFLGGTFFWTFAEYMLHRFLFHYEPRSSWATRLHYYIHGFHHDYPNELNKLAVPPATGIGQFCTSPTDEGQGEPAC